MLRLSLLSVSRPKFCLVERGTPDLPYFLPLSQFLVCQKWFLQFPSVFMLGGGGVGGVLKGVSDTKKVGW